MGRDIAPALLGVLAGMGPRSTAPFIDMLVDECQRQYGARDDIDFPPMMIYSLPTPFYIDRPIDHAALEAAIVGGLRKLESTGVACVAIPCNSAHIYFERLRDCIGVPLLNMVDEALRCVPASTKTIALLATRPTLESRIYQAAIERAGLRMLAGDDWQPRVDQLIQAIKTSLDLAAARARWAALVEDIAAAGADTLLLACTDLNAVGTSPATQLTLLDATRCLAAATVRAWRTIGAMAERVAE